MAAGYVAGDLFLSLVGQPHVAVFNDSVTYLHPSLMGSTGRLWFVPALYWLAVSDEGRVVLQTVVGIGCWLALAAAAAGALATRAARLIAFAAILVIASTPEVVQWNRAILSESLAISVTVALLAASVWLVRRRSWWSLAVWLVAVLAWTFSRQVQALVVAVLAVPLLVAAARAKGRRAVCLVGASAVLGFAAWGIVASLQATSIARFNAVAIVRYRAGTNPAELRYFEAHGLPMVAPLRSPIPFEPSGLPVNVTQHANPADMTRLLSDQTLVRWVDHHWDAVYARYLIGHPSTDLGPPVIEAPTLMTMNPGYVQGPEMPTWLVDAVYGTSPSYLIVLFGLGVAGLVATAWRRRAGSLLWLAAGAVVFDCLWCAAVWNLSASELPRLYDPEAVVAHVLLDLLVVVALDSWWGRGRGRHGAARPSTASTAQGSTSEVLVGSAPRPTADGATTLSAQDGR